MLLPQRSPLTTIGPIAGRNAFAVALPAGYTRLLLPAYAPNATRRRCRSSATRSHASSTTGSTSPRCAPTRARIGSRARLPTGELEALIARRVGTRSAESRARQVALCSREYGCFTAQNVFLERGEAALPVSPKCNARCIGCISEQEPATRACRRRRRASPTRRRHKISRESAILPSGAGRRRHRLVRTRLRRRAAPAFDRDRARDRRDSRATRQRNDQPQHQRQPAGGAPALHRRGPRRGAHQPQFVSAARSMPRTIARWATGSTTSSNRFGWRCRGGLRVSLNLLTHPGVTDDEEEVAATEAFLRESPVAMVQTRTLNIDPASLFRSRRPAARHRSACAARSNAFAALTRVGNFTHTH